MGNVTRVRAWIPWEKKQAPGVKQRLVHFYASQRENVSFHARQFTVEHNRLAGQRLPRVRIRLDSSAHFQCHRYQVFRRFEYYFPTFRKAWSIISGKP